MNVASQDTSKPMSLKQFLSGSWQAYQMVDFEQTPRLTASRINKYLGVFKGKYEYQVQYIPSDDLVLVWLVLQERPQRRSSTTARPSKVKPAAVTKLKLAVAGEDGLLFVNRGVPGKVEKLLTKVLRCQALEALPLSHSDPRALLALHRQAHTRSHGALTLQYEEMMTELMEGKELNQEHLAIQHKLGSRPEDIPCIRKVTTTATHIPIDSNAPELRNFHISEAVMEFISPSIFHLYRDLGSLGLVTELPPWLENMRARGKTSATITFK